MAADLLEVRLQDRRIGAITALGGDRSVFAFDETYLEDEQRPVLSLSFKDGRGGILSDFRNQQTRLLPFFSNLLPEGLLREYLAGRAGVKVMREYPLLEILGGDLPGAVTIRPIGEDLIEEDDARPGPPDAQAPLRFSLAGVQLKFSALDRHGRGLTIPVGGAGGDWIVKLPSTRFAGVSANEFAMMRLASAIGMTIPETRLVPLKDLEGLPEGLGRIEEEAYAIRRFDRPAGSERIHIEDFAQVFGLYPEDKYERGSYRSIARVLWIETGEEGIREFIRRLVFNTLIGNADMHHKNWSLIYPDGRTPELSPGYDFLTTTLYIPDENMALKYGRSKRMVDLGLDELAYMAAKANIPETLVRTTALETVERFRSAWKPARSDLPLSAVHAEEIERLLAVVPIAQGR